MRHKLPDLSTTGLVASGVATLAAAWGASYLGVYGTILGAAFMSVASTAGAAVGKHYLDQGKEQLREMTHLQEQQAARGAASRATSSDPTRTVAWPGDVDATRFMDDPNATRVDGLRALGGDPNVTRADDATRADIARAADVTRVDGPPTEAVADALAAEAGEEAVKEAASRAALRNTKEWVKRRWAVLAVSSVAVFALVIGGITIFEWRTGAAFGNSGGKVSNAFTGGGGGDEKPDDRPSERTPSDGPSTGPSDGPSGEPTPTPTGGSGQPTAPETSPSAPEPAPSEQTPAPTPSASTPDDGGADTPPPADRNTVPQDGG
ncbi:hypothetical protein [Spirillospora sp. NPDC047279]|uniref:hypothetical protein n=1 Tax=Spirillospora sp. NPDC047279 TaxID=3155478 RepID=UPI0033E01B48